MMLTVALVMAAMMAATAVPAFARSSENASCVGQGVTFLSDLGRALFGAPQLGGRVAAGAAQDPITQQSPGPGLSEVATAPHECAF